MPDGPPSFHRAGSRDTISSSTPLSNLHQSFYSERTPQDQAYTFLKSDDPAIWNFRTWATPPFYTWRIESSGFPARPVGSHIQRPLPGLKDLRPYAGSCSILPWKIGRASCRGRV